MVFRVGLVRNGMIRYNSDDIYRTLSRTTETTETKTETTETKTETTETKTETTRKDFRSLSELNCTMRREGGTKSSFYWYNYLSFVVIYYKNNRKESKAENICKT